MTLLSVLAPSYVVDGWARLCGMLALSLSLCPRVWMWGWRLNHIVVPIRCSSWLELVYFGLVACEWVWRDSRKRLVLWSMYIHIVSPVCIYCTAQLSPRYGCKKSSQIRSAHDIYYNIRTALDFAYVSNKIGWRDISPDQATITPYQTL